MKKLHNRVVFEPISRNDLTEQEKKRDTERLILPVHKRSGKIKARSAEIVAHKENILTMTMQ